MEDKVVQAIVLKEDSTLAITHEKAVIAAALASVSFSKIDSKEWIEWLSGSYTKTVRRLKGSKFDKLVDYAESFGLSYSLVEYENVSAIAFSPMLYSMFPKMLSRAQVSGTDYIKTDVWPESDSSYTFFYDSSLVMSTGKFAAQASHILWSARIKGYKISSIPKIRPLSHDKFRELSKTSGIVIVDNGLTEFDGKTSTFLLGESNA